MVLIRNHMETICLYQESFCLKHEFMLHNFFDELYLFYATLAHDFGSTKLNIIGRHNQWINANFMPNQEKA